MKQLNFSPTKKERNCTVNGHNEVTNGHNNSLYGDNLNTNSQCQGQSQSLTSSSQHKLSAECFTKCAKWKLNVTLKANKTSTGLVSIIDFKIQ
jgi:hypothetical protein